MHNTKVKIDLDSIDLDTGLKLENFIPNIPNDKYHIFKTGGYHYLSNVDESVDIGIYRDPIWPWVLNTYFEKGRKIRSTSLGSLTKSDYPVIRLAKKNQQNNNAAVFKALHHYSLIHRVVALVFIKNEDWILNNLVHHINENKLDYRIENLEWTTNKKNSHKGNMGSKIDVNDVYHKVSELRWFKK